jgi:uncharacterized protein
MTQPAKAQEPSMEEILASIRRIIADDDTTKSSQAAAPEPPAAQVAPVPAPMPVPAPAVPPRNPAARPTLVEPNVFDAPPPPPPAPPEPEPVPPASGAGEEAAPDILELTESMTAAVPVPDEPSPEVPAAAQFRTIDGSSDIGFADAPEQPSPRAIRDPQPQLLSRETSAAVDSAFNTLAQTVLVQNARTLEDLVREMLRPMLKGWLDENLPGMVERLVRAEIERVARGR